MTRAERRYRSAIARHLAPIQLGAREYELLRHVRVGETSIPSQLARRCGVTRQFMHRLLNRLQQNGFVERWERDRGRGSDVAVTLTDEGREILDEAELRIACFRNGVLERFGAQQQAALRALLEELDATVELAERRPGKFEP
jgi:DNA-binding MarR family transcriptional regulator